MKFYITGMQCVTPSPLSINIAVYLASANNDISACTPNCNLPTSNFSNSNSAILTRLITGFITASVINSDLPFIFPAPIYLQPQFTELNE
jgi:hypothetical protein